MSIAVTKTNHLFENINTAVLVFDKDLRLSRINTAGENLLSVSQRMVVGHTIQEEVNGACDGALYRIDVGMFEGKKLGTLEIRGDQVTANTTPRVSVRNRSPPATLTP